METKLEDVPNKLLNLTKYATGTIVCSDNVRIPTNFQFLSARLGRFEVSLDANLSEATDKTIKTEFTSKIMQAVLDYLATDKLTSHTKKLSMTEWMEFLAAADFYQSPALVNLLQEHFQLEVSSKDDNFAIQVLSACSSHPNDVFIPMEENCLKRLVAVEFIKQDQPDTFVNLSARQLGVLMDLPLPCSETTVFHMLSQWMGSDENRLEKATELYDHIRLYKVKPTVLQTLVEEPGLVPPKQLLVALSQQLVLYADNKTCYKRKRHQFDASWDHTCISEVRRPNSPSPAGEYVFMLDEVENLLLGKQCVTFSVHDFDPMVDVVFFGFAEESIQIGDVPVGDISNGLSYLYGSDQTSRINNKVYDKSNVFAGQTKFKPIKNDDVVSISLLQRFNVAEMWVSINRKLATQFCIFKTKKLPGQKEKFSKLRPIVVLRGSQTSVKYVDQELIR